MTTPSASAGWHTAAAGLGLVSPAALPQWERGRVRRLRGVLGYPRHWWGRGAKEIGSGPPGSGLSPAQPRGPEPAALCTSQYLMRKQGRQMGQSLMAFFPLAGQPSERGPPSPPSYPLHLSCPRRASEVRECLSQEKPRRQRPEELWLPPRPCSPLHEAPLQVATLPLLS